MFFYISVIELLFRVVGVVILLVVVLSLLMDVFCFFFVGFCNVSCCFSLVVVRIDGCL